MCQPRVDREVEEFVVTLGMWKWVLLSKTSGLAVEFRFGKAKLLDQLMFLQQRVAECHHLQCNTSLLMWTKRKWSMLNLCVIEGSEFLEHELLFCRMLILVVLRSSRVFSQRFEQILEHVGIQNREKQKENRVKPFVALPILFQGTSLYGERCLSHVVIERLRICN